MRLAGSPHRRQSFGQREGTGIERLPDHSAFDAEIVKSGEGTKVLETADSPTRHHRTVGHRADLPQQVKVRAGQRAVAANVGDHVTSASVRVEPGQHLEQLPTLLRPAPGGQRRAAHVQPDRNPVSVARDRAAHPLRPLEGGRADVDPGGAGRKSCLQRLVIADTAGEFHGHLELADHGPQQVGVATTTEGGVKVDQVDPLRTVRLPLQGRVQRVAVRRLRSSLSLHEAHRSAVRHIHCREQLEPGHAPTLSAVPWAPGTAQAHTPGVTDVIGTGDPDAPSHPRRLRLARWATWAGVAVALLALVVVPAARDKFADRAAAWLQDQWAQRSPYDDARAAVILDVNTQAGALDGRIVAQAAALADHEEAAILNRMAHRLAARRMWSGDVSRARDAATAALRFEVTTLRHDADGQPTTGYLFSPQLDKLVATAEKRIASLARRRHLNHPGIKRVALPSATSALDQLRNPTDFATGLSVVTDGPNRPHVLALDTGALTAPLPRPNQSGIEFWNGMIVLSTAHGVHLVDPSGRIRAVLGHHFAQPLSNGGKTLWLRSAAGVRRFDSTGHPLTPWVRPPPKWTAVAAADGFVVLGDFTGESPPPEELWNPTTGVRRRLPTACFEGWTTGGHRVVMIPCDGDRAVRVLDLPTGKLRLLRLPAPYSSNDAASLHPMSPSGDQFVVVLDGPNGVQAELLDLRTGHLTATQADIGLAPVAWSPDGQWVLLAEGASFVRGRRAQIILWRPRDGLRTSVRLPGSEILMEGTELLTASRG
jgi:hypothetical protein